MKTTRIFIIIVLAFIPICAFSQFKYTTSTEVYNGNTYEIHDYGSMYSVTNSTYKFPTGILSNIGSFDGESPYLYWQRIRKQFTNKVDSVVISVFTPEQALRIKTNMGIRIGTTCYWDVRTSNYVGVSFSIPTELKDIVTITKIYEIEQKLANAHLNAGKQYIKELDKKYFVL